MITPTSQQSQRPDEIATGTLQSERWVRLDLVTVITLAVAGAVLRAAQLGPSSLWLDDAWLALVSRADGLGEVVTVGVTAPGFAAALAAVFGVVGPSSVAAQALPFALGVAAAPLLYLLARRLGLGRGAALVGAALVLAAPVHVAYSGRVKPFTADAVLAAVVLFSGWWVVERPDERRRWGWLALVAVGSVMVSAAMATSVAAAYLAGMVAAARGARQRHLRPALASLAAFTGFALVWWWAVIRPASTPSLRAYWADHYIDLATGPGGTGADLAAAVANVVDGFSALPVVVVGLLLGLSVVSVVARRPLLAVLLLAPLSVSVVLAVLEIAPLGGGRTDIHLYPSLALLVALGVHVIGTRMSTVGAWAVPAVVLALVAATVRASPPYPSEDLRPLVAMAEADARADDLILVYSASRWAYALYTSAAVDLRRDRDSPNGFAVHIEDPRVEVLEPHRQDPDRYEPILDRLAEGNTRLWLAASHLGADVPVIERMLRDRGYQAVRTESRSGATLTLWVRGADASGRSPLAAPRS